MAWDIHSMMGKKARPRADFAGKEVAAVGDDAVYLAGQDKLAAHALKGMQRKWEIEFPRVFSLAVAGSTLIVGGDGNVALLDPSNGQKLWSGQVEGEVHGLAVADGRLLVSTDKGRIACFGPAKLRFQSGSSSRLVQESGQSESPRRRRVNAHGKVHSLRSAPQAHAALAAEILRSTGIKAGLCLLTGVGDGQLAIELAKQSDLRIYCAEADENKVAAARKLLDRAGLYGTRVTVHHVASQDPALSRLLRQLDRGRSAGAGPLACAAEELHRVLRPCGGTAYLISAAGGGAVADPRRRVAGNPLFDHRRGEDRPRQAARRGPVDAPLRRCGQQRLLGRPARPCAAEGAMVRQAGAGHDDEPPLARHGPACSSTGGCSSWGSTTWWPWTPTTAANCGPATCPRWPGGSSISGAARWSAMRKTCTLPPATCACGSTPPAARAAALPPPRGPSAV